MGKNNRKTIEKYWSWETKVEAWINFIKSCI